MKHWLVEYSEAVNKDFSSIQVHFLDDAEENNFLNNLSDYPHAFVLACCMDKQVKSDKAWRIPCLIRNLCDTFTIDNLSKISLEEYRQFFRDNALHRFNDDMAEVFCKAVHRIKEQYSGDASRIWADCPSSATVVYRFLQFDGVGIKIATMATNILARQFHIPFSDYYSIDISPDTHVQRIFERVGLVEKGASRESIIYKARELCPEFPGIVDAACWRIGREHCHASNPSCVTCPIAGHCIYAAADIIDDSLFDAAK